MDEASVDRVRVRDDARLDAAHRACLVALGVFLLLTISGRAQDLLPSPARMALVLAWPAALALYMVSRRASVVVAYCLAGGFLLRWVDFFPGGGSDVLPVTNEAIATALSGGNPYAHYYLSEQPPASNFPYPPFELLLHLPGYLVGGLAGVRFTEVAAALLVIVLFAWLARTVSMGAALPAMALYAALPNLVNLSVDASNDTSTGAVLLIAVLAAAWAFRRPGNAWAMVVAGLAAAAALGTKQTTAPVVLMLAVFAWQRLGWAAALRYAGAAAIALAVLAAPFVVMDPARFVTSMTDLLLHQDVYGWNIWVFARSMQWPVADVHTAAVIGGVATVVAALAAVVLRYGRLSSAVVAGVLLTLVLLLTARWTAYAYFAVLAPVVLVRPHPGPARAARRPRPPQHLRRRPCRVIPACRAPSSMSTWTRSSRPSSSATGPSCAGARWWWAVVGARTGGAWSAPHPTRRARSGSDLPCRSGRPRRSAQRPCSCRSTAQSTSP